jgi:hypothetical protein
METGLGTRVPPRYAEDPRVKVRDGGGFTATNKAGKKFNILYSDRDRWMICLDPSVQPMPISNGCYARFMDTPVQAIAFAIGAPIAAVPS